MHLPSFIRSICRAEGLSIMPILYKKNGQIIHTKKYDFKKERELQELLEQNPVLLCADFDPEIRLVFLEMKLDTGRPDILLVDNEGRLTIVEVKLLSNPECKRTVVGQMVDYASTIQDLTYDELNKRVEGKLDEALNSFKNNEIYTYDVRRNFCEQCLESGIFRLIIAVDSVPNALLREWLYVNAHTDIDVRLVAIEKYSTENPDEETIVPQWFVSYNSHSVLNPGGSRPIFLKMVDEFNKIAGYRAVYKGGGNYAVYINEWSRFDTGNQNNTFKPIFYELDDWLNSNEISIEVQIDTNNENYTPLKGELKSRLESVFLSLKSRGLPIVRSDFIPEDEKKIPKKKLARLQFFFRGETNPWVIAQALKFLIDETKPDLTEKLREILKNSHSDVEHI